jgi:pimeloyl-ACP methyl ester carboxylesterase
MVVVDAGSGPRDTASPGSEAGVTPADAGPPNDLATPLPPAPGPDSGVVAAVDPTAAVAVTPIVWGTCPDDMDPEQTDLDDCARLKVPLDYARPDGEQIELLVARMRASDPGRRIGTLFANPGGPGEPGVSGDFLSALADGLSTEIRARFDVVSWDPRGVAASTAVDCMAMPSLPEIQRSHDLSAGTTQKDALTAAYRGWVESCKAKSKLLPFVGTSATVFDLELLRRAVGDAKLTFVGFSYGTRIGLHYLLRFPERVRALVLDAVDAVWPEHFQETDQDQAFDVALNAFFEWCGRASEVDCPFARENPDRAAAFDALVAAIKVNPVPAPRFPGQSVTATLLPWSVAFYLYGEGGWPYLGAALERARMGVGNRLFEAAELYLGPIGPAQDAANAIDCGDRDPVTAAMVEAHAQKVASSRIAVPYDRMSCVGWPVANLTPRPGPVPATIPPVVLVGSTGDPAAPYSWATAAAGKLPGSTLITAVAYDHTSYGYGVPCIDGPVDAYLLQGTIPAAGIRCEFPDPVMEPPMPMTMMSAGSRLEASAARYPARRPVRRR